MKRLLGSRRAANMMASFKKARVLVIGDLIMDHFIWGGVKRISPEAPVPVVEVAKETLVLGGAANVAANIRSLGGKCSVIGVVGRDADGRKLVGKLGKLGASAKGIVEDKRRPTTIKTRIIAHSQQVVRFDREDKRALGKSISDKVFDSARKAIKQADLVVLSDYSKGIITPELISVIKEAAGTRPILVDPKVEHFKSYAGLTLLTPNCDEASLATGIEITDKQTLLKAGKAILNELGCESVLITRGESGMSLFEIGRQTHIPTVAREVFDVSGAGDTVVSVMALAIASGADHREAAVLANLSAGIVVGKVGTATVTPGELTAAIKERLR